MLNECSYLWAAISIVVGFLLGLASPTLSRRKEKKLIRETRELKEQLENQDDEVNEAAIKILEAALSGQISVSKNELIQNAIDVLKYQL